jgi:Holliday junction resolvase
MRYLEKLPGTYCLRPITCTSSGHPDIIALRNGVFYGIEVKQPGKYPTIIQRVRLDKITACGGIAIVATSVDDVKSVMDPAGGRSIGRIVIDEDPDGVITETIKHKLQKRIIT